jgi:phosphomannomutase
MRIAAAPTIGVLVNGQSAAGGVQISASHNPLPLQDCCSITRPGLTRSGRDGGLDGYRNHQPRWKAFDQLSTLTTVVDSASDHLQRVLSTVTVDSCVAAAIVLLDSTGAGLLGARLLYELGCETILVGGEPTGHFLHPPEPTAENLAGVRQQVTGAKADVGFCQDPDADRLAIIDENGRYIGEEYTLAICLDHVLRQRPGPIVTNCATSRMAQDLAAKYGVAFHRSAVGEANVVDKMLEVGAVFGGEGNGGPIDPRVGLVRDSFVGMALVLAAMASRGKQVSELADELPRYEIVKRTVSLPSRLPTLLNAIERHFADASADRLDGLRLIGPIAGSRPRQQHRAIADHRGRYRRSAGARRGVLPACGGVIVTARTICTV